MLIHWSSVRAVKGILILVSFIISIFGVNSQINILWENVNAFFYQGKNALNLQVEIIWGIISIIILSSLIFLNRSIIILFLLNLALVRFDSVFTFDFFVQYNLVILISFGHQTLKKAVFDIVQWPNCIKHLVWKSLIGILFNFVLSNTLHTRNTRVLQFIICWPPRWLLYKL